MLNRPRIIPVLTIINRDLVKTTKFVDPRYLGDPINAVKIFNGKSVDELCVLDIRATVDGKGPDFEFLEDLASEAFMPLAYGGGIRNISDIERLFYIGFEKVIFNTAHYTNPELIRQAVKLAGSQSVVFSLDCKPDLFGKWHCYSHSGKQKINASPVDVAKGAEAMGFGEIILSTINKDGSMTGYELEMINKISQSISIPLIALGGAKDIKDLKLALDQGAHAVAAASMFVYYGRQKAVLISMPTHNEFESIGIYK